MLKILFRQPLHIWRTLEWRYKIEAILLFILVFAFVGTRLEGIFIKSIGETFTPIELLLLVSNIFIFLLAATTLLTISWLFPRQRALRTFLTRPLNNTDFIKILAFYSLKYASFYLILFLPTLAALTSAINVWAALASIIIVYLFFLFFLILFIRQKQHTPRTKYFLTRAVLALLIYQTLFAAFFYFKDYLVLFQVITTGIAFVLLLKMYFSPVNFNLENFVSYLEEVYSRLPVSKTSFKKIPQFLPAITQALFEKEWLEKWRNPNYKKLKIKNLAAYLILNTLVVLLNFEHKEIWISSITALLIWGHYNNSFNEKYVFADPTGFIKTLPMRFRHLFAAKYVAEMGYVFLLTLCTVIFFQFINLSVGDQFIWLGGLFIFANVILFTMLNFKIMFFNDARLAGYAYNFAMFFMAIMVLNFHLVGPVIGLALLMFFLYKNVRYFNE